MPYHRSKKREVLVQRFDGKSWDILPTVLRRGSEGHSSHPGGRPARVLHQSTSVVSSASENIRHNLSVLWPLQLACCSVRHFSWFMVVSRPVRDSCSLTEAGTLLVSTTDPGVKLRFPPNSTLQPRTVTLQVAGLFSF